MREADGISGSFGLETLFVASGLDRDGLIFCGSSLDGAFDSVLLLALEEGRIPLEYDASGGEIVGPLETLIDGEEIGLVEEEHRLFAERLDVIFEIGTEEEERVSGVDDLDEQIASLCHSPELSPDLEILFEGRQEQLLLFFDLDL